MGAGSYTLGHGTLGHHSEPISWRRTPSLREPEPLADGPQQVWQDGDAAMFHQEAPLHLKGLQSALGTWEGRVHRAVLDRAGWTVRGGIGRLCPTPRPWSAFLGFLAVSLPYS